MSEIIKSIDEQSNSEWQHLSPFSIVFFVINFTIRFIKDGLINLVPALAIFVTQVENKLYWLSVVAVVFIVCLVVYSILYYRSFKFRVNNSNIILNRGVFNKESTTLNFDKVQNVNLATPFYFEPLKLVNCIFDSAGSSQKEISLPGISAQYANQVQSSVDRFKRQHTQSQEAASNLETASEQQGSNLLLSLGTGEIARFGLSSNMTFILLAVLAPFMETIVEFSKNSIVPALSAILTPFVSDAGASKAAAVVVIISATIFGAILLSVIAAIVQFYNYQLFDEGSHLKRVAGLFEKHQISIAKRRVQAISVKQNWVFKLLRRVTVQYHQLAVAKAGNAKNKNNLSIPTLASDGWEKYVANTFSDLADVSIHFVGISARYLSHCIVVFWLIPITVITLLLMRLEATWIYLLGVIPIGALLVYLKWRQYGIWFNDDYIAIKSGFIGSKTVIIPIYKIQNITFVQTSTQKRNRVATLKLQLPYGKESIPFLPKNKAIAIMNLVAYQVASSNKKWL